MRKAAIVAALGIALAALAVYALARADAEERRAERLGREEREAEVAAAVGSRDGLWPLWKTGGRTN